MAMPWEDGVTRAARLASQDSPQHGKVAGEMESYAPARARPHPPNRSAVGPLLPP